MATVMKEVGKRVVLKVKVYSTILMESIMKVNGKKENHMAMVNANIPLQRFTIVVDGRMASLMAMVSYL